MAEREAIVEFIVAGKQFGYENLIAHLQTAWARELVSAFGYDEKSARLASGGDGYPFDMQDDIINRCEYDETGERYRK